MNNDDLFNSRSKYFEDLDYAQNTPEDDDFIYSPGPSPKPQKTNKSSSPTKTFWWGLIGAIIGTLLVFAIMIPVLYYMGAFGGTTTQVITQPATETTGDVQSNQTLTSDIEAVAQKVPQSVVGIQATGTATTDSIFGPTSQDYTSIGSGFFVTNDGYVVTNQHVVGNNPQKIVVSTDDGSETEGTLIWADASIDLAVVKTDLTNVTPLELGDSANVKVGQTVIAVGNPLGLAYSRSVTSGIVSAVDRSLVVNDTLVAEGLIQTDAAINSGNSGGPLCNLNGEVIGINTYKQQQGEGLGFAIPINLFKPIIQEVVQTGNFQSRTIGITGYDPEQAQYLTNGQIPSFSKGIYIVEVTAGSPAERAGLQPGDILKSVDGTDINTMIQLRTILYNHKADDTVNVVYERNGEDHSVSIKLGS